MEHIPQLIFANLTISILVKHRESDAQVLLIQKPRTVHCSCDKFTIVNLAITVGIKLVDQIVPVLAASSHYSKHLAHACLQLFNCQESIVRCV